MYDYEDYDYPIETSELDEILNKYLEEAKKYFLDSFKTYIEEVKEKEEQAKLDFNRAWEKERELIKKERELIEKESEIEKKKNDLILEMLQRFGLDLTPGQKVYVIYTKTIRHECPRCKGKGKITAEFDNLKYEAECPDCNHYGDICTYERQVVSGTVSDMSVRLYWNVRSQEIKEYQGYWNDESSSNIYINLERNNPWRDDTKSFHRTEIYLTEEEARKAIEEEERENK